MICRFLPFSASSPSLTLTFPLVLTPFPPNKHPFCFYFLHLLSAFRCHVIYGRLLGPPEASCASCQFDFAFPDLSSISLLRFTDQTTLPTLPPSVRLSTFCIVLNCLDCTVHTGRWKYCSWCLVVPRLWRAWCTEPLLLRELRLLMLTLAHPQGHFCRSDKLIFGFSSIIGTFQFSHIVTESFVESKESSLCDVPLSLSPSPTSTSNRFCCIRIYEQYWITIVECYSKKE